MEGREGIFRRKSKEKSAYFFCISLVFFVTLQSKTKTYEDKTTDTGPADHNGRLGPTTRNDTDGQLDVFPRQTVVGDGERAPRLGYQRTV